MKRRINNNTYISWGIALLISITMLLPAVVSDSSGNTYSGVDIAFGKDMGSQSITMNFFALLGFLLPLLISIVGAIMKDFSKDELMKYVMVALGLAFLLSVIALFTILSTEISIFNGFLTSTFSKFGGYSLGIGSIMGACFSILGLIFLGLDVKNMRK